MSYGGRETSSKFSPFGRQHKIKLGLERSKGPLPLTFRL